MKNTAQAPYHVGLGTYIEITCDGITSLRADQVGTEMNFLDINKAHRDGYFGKEPRIWGDKDWSLLIDYLSGGTEYSPQERKNIAYLPQVWSTISQARSNAPPGMKANILQLKNRAEHQGDYLKHMCGLKPFMACDALSSITESTAEGTEDDRSEASFANMQKNVWNTAMRKAVPVIKVKVRSFSRASPGAATGKAGKAYRAPTRSEVDQHESTATSSSSKNDGEAQANRFRATHPNVLRFGLYRVSRGGSNKRRAAPGAAAACECRGRHPAARMDVKQPDHRQFIISKGAEMQQHSCVHAFLLSYVISPDHV